MKNVLQHRMRRRDALGLAAGAWAGTVRPSAWAQAALPVELPKAIADGPYQLVKNWDFREGIRDQEALRKEFFTRYIYNDGKQDKLNDEWQRYRDNQNHEFLADGLSLTARAPNGLANGKIESGMLRSRWIGQYGYVEGRIKVPAGRGMWPAFWLNPEDKVWPPEIDILEVVNNGQDTTLHSFHFVHPGERKAVPTPLSLLDKRHRYTSGSDLSQDFHRFAVLWEPGRVRHYVDDVLVVDRLFAWTHKDGSDAGPAHVLINLAVGGKWPGPPLRVEDFPARLEVAYIRVWQRPGQ